MTLLYAGSGISCVIFTVCAPSVVKSMKKTLKILGCVRVWDVRGEWVGHLKLVGRMGMPEDD